MQVAANQTDLYAGKGSTPITPYLISSGAARLIEFMTKAFDAPRAWPMPTPRERSCTPRLRSMIHKSNCLTGTRIPASPTCLHIYVADADATYSRALQLGRLRWRACRSGVR